MQLSSLDLTNLLDQGWTIKGGPYDDEPACIPNCGGSSSSNSNSDGCCGFVPGNLGPIVPDTLNLTLNAETGCSCLDGVTTTLIWDDFDQWTYSGLPVPGCLGIDPTIGFSLTCDIDVGGWQLFVTECGGTGGGGQLYDLVTSSCTPFSLTFNSPTSNDCCSLNFSVTITG